MPFTNIFASHMPCSFEAATVNLDFFSVRIFCSTFARNDCQEKFLGEVMNYFNFTTTTTRTTSVTVSISLSFISVCTALYLCVSLYASVFMSVSLRGWHEKRGNMMSSSFCVCLYVSASKFFYPCRYVSFHMSYDIMSLLLCFSVYVHLLLCLSHPVFCQTPG